MKIMARFNHTPSLRFSRKQSNRFRRWKPKRIAVAMRGRILGFNLFRRKF